MTNTFARSDAKTQIVVNNLPEDFSIFLFASLQSSSSMLTL
jgi:hypothetical protein